MSFPTPANFAPGDRELDVLANLLGNGKSSRLYRRMVYDLKIAQSVSATQDSSMLASDFEISASPMPGHTLDELMTVISEEINKLQKTPADAIELERAKNQIESGTVRSLEPLIARAERLQHYNYLLGDPGYLAEDLRRYRAVDAEAVRRAAEQYLKLGARVVVTVEPNPDAPIMGRVVKK
jgi:zinc protease